jgi:hypothetical protein
MRRWASIGIALVLVSSGCDGSGSVTTPSSTDGVSSFTTTSTPSSTTSSTQVAGLRSEFIAWVAPIDGDEARLGWEAYELPGWRIFFSTQADCWRDNGFGEFADQVRAIQPDMLSLSGRLLPDMSRYRQVGFWRERNSPANNVLESAGDEEDLTDTLSYDVDVALRPEDVAAIHAVGVKCQGEDGGFYETMGLLAQSSQWLFQLDDVDRLPELDALIEADVLPCLRDIGPEFSYVDSIDLWLSTQFGRQATLDTDPDTPRDVFEEKMVYWGQSYAACMEPLVEARREPRLEARDAFVDEKFTELLQLQSDVDDFLAGSE